VRAIHPRLASTTAPLASLSGVTTSKPATPSCTWLSTNTCLPVIHSPAARTRRKRIGSAEAMGPASSIGGCDMRAS